MQAPRRGRLIWINGPFGVGKSTLAACLVEVLDDACLFHPEEVGGLLRQSLGDASDYRVWPEWHALVAAAADELTRRKSFVVAPMSVSDQKQWDDLNTRLADLNVPTSSFVLVADHDEMLERIKQSDVSMKTKEFRLSYLGSDLQSFASGSFGVPIHTGDMSMSELCASVRSRVVET